MFDKPREEIAFLVFTQKNEKRKKISLRYANGPEEQAC
jgi:hypothetical protein